MQTIIKIQEKIKLLSIITDIDSKDTLEKATEVLSQAKLIEKEIKENHKAEAEPYETPLKEIDDRYKPSEKAIKSIIDDIRSKITAYQTEAIKLAKAEEDAIASRIGDGKGKIKLETAIKKIDSIERPEDSIKTATGKLSFREKKVLKITDLNSIPREYLIPNESMIMEALKEGKEVKGCEVEIVQVPVNRI